jgi:hypothetical protein
MEARLNGALCGLALTLGTIFNPTHASPILWVDDSIGNLATVDVATGSVNVIGNMGATMTDIAFDPSGNLYGIDFFTLYSINPATAAVTSIGATGTTLNSLVFNSDGTLYSANNALYTIDTGTGLATLVGNGGDAYSSSGDLAFIGDELYLSSSPGDQLFRLDKSTGVGTNIGNIGFPSVFGLATNNNVDLFGVSGTQVISVDLATGAGSLLVNYSGQGLSSAFGSSFIEEASVIPVPPAVWLFASGLLGLVGMARRNKAG